MSSDDYLAHQERKHVGEEIEEQEPDYQAMYEEEQMRAENGY